MDHSIPSSVPPNETTIHHPLTISNMTDMTDMNPKKQNTPHPLGQGLPHVRVLYCLVPYRASNRRHSSTSPKLLYYYLSTVPGMITPMVPTVMTILASARKILRFWLGTGGPAAGVTRPALRGLLNPLGVAVLASKVHRIPDEGDCQVFFPDASVNWREPTRPPLPIETLARHID
jgi:hypothetical protein